MRGRLEIIYDILRIAWQKTEGIAKTKLIERANLNSRSPHISFCIEKGLLSIKSQGKHTYCEITSNGRSALICFEELFKRL